MTMSERKNGRGMADTMTEKEKRKIKKLIEKIGRGFDAYREDWDNGSDVVEDPLAELDDYVNGLPVTEKESGPDKMEVATKAGFIRAYKSMIPGQPGICVMLQPDGYKEEIDISFASVYEDPEYKTEDGEEPSDVVVMTYGDPRTEDYTKKDIIRREAVVEGMGL